MTQPDSPEAWEKLYKKLIKDIGLMSWDWSVDMHDCVRLKLNTQDRPCTVEIVDKTPFASDKAFAQVAAQAIACTFYDDGGFDLYGKADGLHLHIEDSELERVIAWEDVLNLNGNLFLGSGKVYLAVADKLEELAKLCRERAPAAAALQANNKRKASTS